MNSKNIDHIGNGLSKVSAAEELNTLSYLVRKHPKRTMEHLSSTDMLDELAARGAFTARADARLASTSLLTEG